MKKDEFAMNKDSQRSVVHLRQPHIAVFLQDWAQEKLEFGDISVPAEYQPKSMDEDDTGFVPDPHAAFGLVKNVQQKKQPAWKDLGLGELLERRANFSGDKLLVDGPKWSVKPHKQHDMKVRNVR